MLGTMRAQEVMKYLKISRRTLARYVKDGYIKYYELPSGQYRYIAESVYALGQSNIIDELQIALKAFDRALEAVNKIDDNWTAINGLKVLTIETLQKIKGE